MSLRRFGAEVETENRSCLQLNACYRCAQDYLFSFFLFLLSCLLLLRLHDIHHFFKHHTFALVCCYLSVYLVSNFDYYRCGGIRRLHDKSIKLATAIEFTYKLRGKWHMHSKLIKLHGNNNNMNESRVQSLIISFLFIASRFLSRSRSVCWHSLDLVA